MAMALRSMVRRWPAAPSQARALLLQQQSRFYAEEYTGKGLNEKEKAAENRFIRNLEEERKLKKQAADEAGAHAESSVTPSATAEAAGTKTEGGFPLTAVVAGLVVAIGGYWLLSGSSKKEQEK